MFWKFLQSKRFLMAVIISTILISGNSNAFAGTSFVDLTSKEYKGPDSALSGFSLTKFGVNCEENGTYVPGQDTFVSWEDHSARTEPFKATYGVKSYTIHFRVLDRKGKIIHEEDFTYSRNSTGGDWPHKGKVIWGNPNYNCDRSGVRFSKKIDLSFATFEYWVTKIEWMPKP